MDDKAKMEALLGGTEITIILLGGATEIVKVRQLPVALMGQYARAVDDESEMVELFIGRPKGWSQTITNESFEQIVEEGERLNETFFARWRERQKKRLERIAPGMVERLTSQITSPNSPSVPDSPSKKP